MNKHYIVHLVSVCLIVSLLYIGHFSPRSEYTNNTDFLEPPGLEGDVKTVSDILQDLGGLGCILINCTEWSHGGMRVKVTYEVFRRVAYNTKIVFVEYHYKSISLPSSPTGTTFKLGDLTCLELSTMVTNVYVICLKEIEQ